GDIPTPKGVSGRLSILARGEATPYLSAHASAAAFSGTSGEDGLRVGGTAIEAGIPYVSLQVGNIGTWYGPGRFGALIFTNNARSYPGVRLHNPVPIPVPGLFSFLGTVQYDLFLARLGGEDRPVRRPLLTGMRLAARPSRFLELGASRAFQFGGEGREESLSTYFEILTGARESEANTPKGNSLASVDAKVNLPLRIQPLALYVEWGGEDQSERFIFTRHALLAGVFLPSIGPFRRVDLRIERGSTLTNAPGVWYRHGDYPHEYRGRILGHPMGTDATDLSVQGHYFFLPSTYLEVTLARTDRSFTGDRPKERTDRASAGLVGWLYENVRVEGELARERVKDAGGLPGASGADTSFRVAFSYQLGTGK
ncbi:MAG: capsule assembly Wzi family protein, partial [Candidatus Deferrimicrobiaceae bacterium]